MTSAGVDAGFSPEPGTLRAPDVAVGGLPDAHGWAPGAPPLAVEYPATGQDEAELQRHGYESLDAVRLEGEVEGKAEGKAEGLALGLLGVLSARGLALDEAQRARVKGCRDPEALQRWLARAAVATTVADILD